MVGVQFIANTKTIEQSRAYVAARGAKILSYSITIDGYDSMSSVMCTQDEVDPGTEKARKELEERLVKRKAEKKETEERLEKTACRKTGAGRKETHRSSGQKNRKDLQEKVIKIIRNTVSLLRSFPHCWMNGIRNGKSRG